MLRSFALSNGKGKTYFLSLNNYKTNKKYKEKIIPIPKELMYTYRQYVAKQRPLKYLITTKKGQKVSRNYFTQFLQKISKKCVDTTGVDVLSPPPAERDRTAVVALLALAGLLLGATGL